jgi:hypothetical protein
MAKSKKKEYKSLLSLLATSSPEEAVTLIIKEGGEKPRNTGEIEFKLAKVYAASTRKPELEKKFAEMHPHKNFILKYLTPKEEPKEVVKEVIVSDNTIPADGRCGCNRCKCGCQNYSNADGSQDNKPTKDNTTVIVLGLVSIVAIVSMFSYLQKK